MPRLKNLTHDKDAEDATDMVDVPSDQRWEATVEKTLPAIVIIDSCAPWYFDTDTAGCNEATGFVVDAKNGYILTNKHVVGRGPSWCRAVFYQRADECLIYPVYVDPLHDFAICRFDPSSVQNLKIAEIPMKPDLAKVGLEVRLLGNDAGECMSIFSGVISRVDRNAPDTSANDMS